MSTTSRTYRWRRLAPLALGACAMLGLVFFFFNDSAERRRSLLIERLLKTSEFGDNFGNIWTVMLLTRSGSQKVHQEQMRDWIAEQFNNAGKEGGPKNGWADTVTELISATGV